jgi:hypothetical protein
MLKHLLVVLLVLVMVAMIGGSAMAFSSFDDVQAGNWDAWQTWNATDLGYPSVDGDTVLIDTAKVTVPNTLAIPTAVTVGGSGILYIPTAASGTRTETAALTLDGGQLFLDYVYSTRLVDYAGTITVNSDSEIQTTGWGNRDVHPRGIISGNIVDGATTGQLHNIGTSYTGLVLSGDNSGFSGGFLVDAPGSVSFPPGSYDRNNAGLRLNSDGALGTGDTVVNTSLFVRANQTNAGGRPAPNSVTLSSGSTLRFRDNDAYHANITVTNWDVISNGATIDLADENAGFVGGSLAVNAETTLYMAPDNRWSATGQMGCTISGTEDLIVTDTGAGDDGTPSPSRVRFTADNSGFSGDIRVVRGAAPATPITLIAVGAAANALGVNNNIIISGDCELEVDVLGALGPTNTLYLLAGSAGLLDLNVAATVWAVHVGGTWDDGLGEVDISTGEWLGVGQHTGGYTDYIDFGGNTLTVLDAHLVPEPAGLGLIGLALLGLRKKRS